MRHICQRSWTRWRHFFFVRWANFAEIYLPPARCLMYISCNTTIRSQWHLHNNIHHTTQTSLVMVATLGLMMFLGSILLLISYTQTLTAEVQAYLLDLQRGTNSIMFWQVHLILSILIQKTHSHTYNYRKISFNTLPSLPLLWIFCPFRAQLCLARGFSLPPRRPCQFTATVSRQNWWRLCRCWNSWFWRVGV